MPRLLSLVLSRGLLAAVAGGLTAGAAHALTFTGFNPTLDCTQLSYPAMTFEADRNNTGSPAPGAEAYAVEIRDGAGVVLFSFTNPGYPMTGPVADPGFIMPYTAAPTANPITLTFVSAAGNGLPRQVAFTASGSCSTLPPAVVTPVPALGAWGLAALAGLMAMVGIGRARRQRRG